MFTTIRSNARVHESCCTSLDMHAGIITILTLAFVSCYILRIKKKKQFERVTQVGLSDCWLLLDRFGIAGVRDVKIT